MHYKNIPELGGRTLVSSCSYNSGDVVISVDQPVLDFPLKTSAKETDIDEAISAVLADATEGGVSKDELTACVSAFLTGGGADIDLEDYFAPEPLPVLFVKIAQRISEEESVWCKGEERPTVSALSRFIAVNVCNSHQEDGRVRLYKQISKIAHSCSPNLLLTASADGMTATAVRSIAPEEPLSISYLGETAADPDGLICGSLRARRAKLLATKFFHCRCARCLAEEGELTSSLELEQSLWRALAASFAAQYAVAASRAVDWTKVREVVADPTRWVLTQPQHAALLLALAAQDLLCMPTLYGWGIVTSERLLDEGARCLAALTQYYHLPTVAIGLAVGAIWPFLPQLQLSLGRLPKNIPITAGAAELQLFAKHTELLLLDLPKSFGSSSSALAALAAIKLRLDI